MTDDVDAQPAPTAFICHATEDKKRFVDTFARMLRENGVDAWYDKWEMEAGDRLTDKIGSGIQNAQAFIIVLSPISITKKWVREELNAGLIRGIDEKARVIPVILEKCEVPPFLDGRMWVDMTNPKTREAEFERLLFTLHGKRNPGKPPVLRVPAIERVPESAIPGLTAIEALVLKCACEFVTTHPGALLEGEDLEKQSQLAGIGNASISEAVERMDGSEFGTERTLANHPVWGDILCFWPTVGGFEKYAVAYVGEYAKHKRRIANEVLRAGHADSGEMATHLSLPPRLVSHVFEWVARIGLALLSDELGQDRGIYMVKTAKLRHALANDDI